MADGEIRCPHCGEIVFRGRLTVDKVSDTGILNMPLEDLGLSTRALNALLYRRGWYDDKARPIKTLGELASLTKNDLRYTPYIGPVTIAEIIEALGKFGLKLKSI